MKTMPPEMREDKGEIEESLKGRIPRLLELSDIRGDLHVHTDFSDGKSSTEEMIEAADELGYEYIALTDHSPAARIAHGLTLDRLAEKRALIEKLNRKRKGHAPEILFGTEVDILPDGSLDYPDTVLAKFDIVVAAVHSGFKEGKDRMTGRILDALANPHVHILAHPTSRLLGSRDPVQFDFERILQRAAENNIALEVNASYLRLDLNDSMSRAAQSAGVWLCLGSDSHSASQLTGMRFGVYQARRGWVRPSSVINTMPFGKLRKWLEQPRKYGHRRVGNL
jgi:DNA polymerase (family X)